MYNVVFFERELEDLKEEIDINDIRIIKLNGEIYNKIRSNSIFERDIVQEIIEKWVLELANTMSPVLVNRNYVFNEFPEDRMHNQMSLVFEAIYVEEK